jgi:hypothetical protein
MLAQFASTIIGNNNVRVLWLMHMKWIELKQATNTEWIAIAISESPSMSCISSSKVDLIELSCLEFVNHVLLEMDNKRKQSNGLIDGGIEEFVLKQ